MESFFDFPAAKALWSQLRTPDQVKAYRQKACPSNGPYSKWERQFDKDQKAALKALDDNTSAAQIKQCHDFYLAAYKWDQLWSYWKGGVVKKTWNGLDEASKKCAAISKHNIFTGKCNDLPNWSDWRN